MALIITIALILISKRAKYFLHMVQLEGYKTESYKKWLNNNKTKAYSFSLPVEEVKKPLVFVVIYSLISAACILCPIVP